MHIIEPAVYGPRPKVRHWRLYVAIPTTVIIILGAANYLRPLPVPTATIAVHTPAASTPGISWPAGGQAAVAAEGYGILDTSGNQTPLATASITKIILALCVLQKQPLTTGQTGPSYSIGTSDVAIYQQYADEDGSLLPVVAGERLTEYQALQALLLPSANNIADSLVAWVFGGQTAYSAYATAWLQQNGFNDTHIGSDGSGFDGDTVSTASDLTQLGLLAAQNPVLMQVAGQSSAILPVAGTVTNYDTALGQSGIDGLKTGNNDTDPGAFLFTATRQVGDKNLRLSGTVMGAPDLDTALQESVQLAASTEQGFEQVQVVRAGQTVGTLQARWGASVPIVASKPVSLVRWEATPVTVKHHVDTARRSGTVGTLQAAAGPASATVNLRLVHPLAGPGFWWRLTRR
ncbi:MAG TPA: hypothetical protein VGM08_00715 [Candidatus Saccharimonadales bacterium]